jgi:hypothetical protein
MKQWLFLLTVVVLSGCGSHPRDSFEATSPPRAPDYDKPQDWLALPGRNGFERSVPQGDSAVEEGAAIADVFFIHPTTYLKNDVWNVALDARTTYGVPVLLNQASAFNGCCRIFAPHYRQAALYALNASRPAVDLAFSDVEKAFRWYIEHENHGRPFILASHSQGSTHAVRLLQQDILGTPLKAQLIAAYVIGAYVPEEFSKVGLPICDAPDATGCIVSWNTSQAGRRGAELLIHDTNYWWQGKWIAKDLPPAVCVNPLNWHREGPAAASANLGSSLLPSGYDESVPNHPVALPAVNRGVTSAVCDRGLLDVDISLFKRGYFDLLRVYYGSFHVADYGLFYENIRVNALQRSKAWRAGRDARSTVATSSR